MSNMSGKNEAKNITFENFKERGWLKNLLLAGTILPLFCLFIAQGVWIVQETASVKKENAVLREKNFILRKEVLELNQFLLSMDNELFDLEKEHPEE